MLQWILPRSALRALRELLGGSDQHHLCDVLFLFLSKLRNRCIPVVNATTETKARCIVPESPEDPSDPNYIDPYSRECLAQSVETKETKTQASNQDVVTNALLNFQVFIGRTASDVQASYLVIALSVLLSFVLGFFFLVRIRRRAFHLAFHQNVLEVHYLGRDHSGAAALRPGDDRAVLPGRDGSAGRLVRRGGREGRRSVPLGKHHLRFHYRKRTEAKWD